jgi:hypothetical protein
VLDLIDKLFLHGLEARLDVFGDGELLPEAVKIKSRLESAKSSLKITIHGAVDRPELIAELNKFHILIQTSDFEGTPLAIIEAMRSGVVPVSTDYGPEVHNLIPQQMAGLIVNSDDMKEMASKIVALSKNPDRLKFFSKLCRMSSCKQGTSSQWIRNFDSIYMPPVKRDYSFDTLYTRYKRHIINFICDHDFLPATVLWGGGEIGRMFIDEAKKKASKSNILGLIDQTLHKFFCNYRGVKYYSKDDFDGLLCDEVIVTSRYFSVDIMEHLNNINFTRCKPFRVTNLFAEF